MSTAISRLVRRLASVRFAVALAIVFSLAGGAVALSQAATGPEQGKFRVAVDQAGNMRLLDPDLTGANNTEPKKNEFVIELPSSERVAALDNWLSALEGGVSDLQSGLDEVQGAVGDLSSRVGGVEGGLGYLQDALGGLDSRVGGVEDGLGALQTALGELDGRVGGLEGALGGLQSGMEALEALLADPDTGLAALAGRLDGLVSVVGDLQAGLDALQAQLDGLQARLGSMEGAVADPQSGLGALAARLADLENRVSTLESGGAGGDGDGPPEPPPTNLVLWLPMDEGTGSIVADGSGHGNNGTVHGATWVQLPTGTWVLDFSGAFSYVDVGSPEILALGNADFSLEAWVKGAPRSGGSTGLIWYKGWNFYNYAGGPDYQLKMYDGAEGLNAWAYGILDNEWHHVVFTVDRSTNTVSAYVDGVLSHSNTNPAVGDISSPQNVYIGGMNGPRDLAGMISRVGIYAAALDSATVQQRFDEAKALFGIP